MEGYRVEVYKYDKWTVVFYQNDSLIWTGEFNYKKYALECASFILLEYIDDEGEEISW